MTEPRKSCGLSLLEMLVALSIMSVSLVVIYQAVAGSARGIGQIASSHHALLLADSLLDAHAAVPVQGIQAQGEDGMYAWSVSSQPVAGMQPVLHQLSVRIQWQGRQLALETLRPQLTQEAAP